MKTIILSFAILGTIVAHANTEGVNDLYDSCRESLTKVCILEDAGAFNVKWYHVKLFMYDMNGRQVNSEPIFLARNEAYGTAMRILGSPSCN